MQDETQDFADETEGAPEEGRTEPVETEGIGLTINPGPDEGDDHAELKEDWDRG